MFIKKITQVSALLLIAVSLVSTTPTASAQYGGGTITIGTTANTNSSTTKPESIKIEDPYTCGKDIQGKVVSATLSKITVELKSSSNSYSFNPSFDSTGFYSFVPTEKGVTPGMYTVTYFAETTSGLQSDKLSYQADIKLLKDCPAKPSTTSNGSNNSTTGSNNSNSPKITNLSTEKSNNPVNSAVNGLIRTGGENVVSILTVLVLAVISAFAVSSFKKSKE